MQKTHITFGIDWDDVIAPLNSVAVAIYNEQHQSPITLDVLTHWNSGGMILGDIYQSMELYEKQSPIPEAVQLIHELETIGNVYIATHPLPHVEPFRRQQIHQTFPEIPEDRILIGSGKETIPFTFLLDDNLRTIQLSKAEFPVLLDQPWNQESEDSKYRKVFRIYGLPEFLDFVKSKIQ